MDIKEEGKQLKRMVKLGRKLAPELIARLERAAKKIHPPLKPQTTIPPKK